MGLLRLTVFGSPEVFHNGSRLTFSLRKAQALLLYLGVEGGMHPRSQLAALLWPDSEPRDARTALRNTIALLRDLLSDSDDSTVPHSHLLSQGDLLGLNPQAPFELDLNVVQQAYQQAQMFSALPSEPERASLLAQWQHALSLMHGSFLDGFWLREETPFDRWHEQQQQQWQVRLQFLFDRLSSWQEAFGELKQAIFTLTRWLALDTLQEEAYRRLMRLHLAQGDPTAALQVYAACQARLDEELHLKPSPETVALAERIRAAHRRGSPSARLVSESMPPGELIAPLVGRAGAFSQLVARYQQVQQGQPQAVLLVGEAGIGKTRLASDFIAWTRAQGADVLRGQFFHSSGRLLYQPLIEAIRPRLEEENAPEDLLEDLWLAELSRILPELRVRYPDLPVPTQDEMTAQVRLFEAVARLMDALTKARPLVLLLEDLHWVDGASLDLIHYLARYWKMHGTMVLLLGTVRTEELERNLQLASGLSALGRDLPLTQMPLQPLSQAETIRLIEAIVGLREQRASHGGGREDASSVQSASISSAVTERSQAGLGDFLFAQTRGQPFYLLEMLKMFRDRQWLLPRRDVDGSWRLVPTLEMATALAQEQPRHGLLPPSVRALILERLRQLSLSARQLVIASAVLANQATAQQLWQLAGLEEQAGIEALEEVVGSGILREERAGRGYPVSYGFTHDLMGEVIYTGLSEARRRISHQRALVLLQRDGSPVAELAYHALAAGEVEIAYRYSLQAGDEAMAVFAVEDAIGLYEKARALLHEHGQQARGIAIITVQDIAERAMVNRTSFREVVHLYISLGRAYAFQNRWQKAQEAYEELLAYGQQQRLPTLISMALNRLAILAAQQSHERPQVRALLGEAWRVAQRSHDEWVLAETEWNLAQIMTVVWEDPKNALPHGAHALELARAIRDKELEARSLSSLGMIHMLGGDFEEAMTCLEASSALYAVLGNKPLDSRELSLPSFIIGAPLTQALTNRATEAWCRTLLAMAQVHHGQMHNSIRSSRLALALSKESKNVWAQISSTTVLTHGLLDTGAYEEALMLTQQTVALAQTLPSKLLLQGLLIALGSTYQTLQQWEQALRTLEEEEAVAGTLEPGPLRVLALSQLCMHYALAKQWEQAYRYALQAITVRRKFDMLLTIPDFSRHYETEALLRGGNEKQAREEVQRLGEHIGSSQRLRVPYLRSSALLSAWQGDSEQAIAHLRATARLTVDLGLPGEAWQIQAALAALYETAGEQAKAETAFAEAASIIQKLAQGIGDELLRTSFLTGPQIQPVLQQAQSVDSLVLKGHSAWR